EVVDQSMTVAVRRDLVSLFGDRAHQPRVALGDPAENEERRLDVGLVEHLEQTLGVRADAAFHPFPGMARHETVEDADVEVVFHVDGHRVDNRSAHCPLRRSTVLMVSKTMNRSSAIDMFLM